MGNATLNEVLNEFNRLPLGEKEYVVEVMERQLIEAKREAIAKRAKKAMTNLRKGTVRKGTIRELYKDLESD
jgi:hypothetical protein